MARRIEITAKTRYPGSSIWDAEAIEYVNSVLTRRFEGTGDSEEEATVEALEYLAREIKYDERGHSDRCQTIERALQWWADLMVPKAECPVCKERVTVEDIEDGMCSECRFERQGASERLEYLRDIEMDRRVDLARGK